MKRFRLQVCVLASLFICSISAYSDVVAQEQFNYTTGVNIHNQNGGSGFNGAWVSTISHGKIYDIQSAGLSYTDLPVVGKSLSRYGASGRAEAHRLLSSASRTALTADNTTMWFSVLFQEPDSPYKHGSFLFGTDAFTTLSTPILASNGYGFGFTLQRAPYGDYQGNGSINALFYNGSASPTVVAGTYTPNLVNATSLIVGKINFKPSGTPDEFFLFNVTDLYNEPDESTAFASITNMDFNQSAFDTIAMWDSNNAVTDEIRFGNTFNDVMGGISVLPAIPDVTGQQQAAAESNITDAGFTVGLVTTASSDTVAQGYVINQNPSGHAESATAINLVVSSGLPIIPDVTGQLQAAAVANITAAGFTVGEVTKVNNDTVQAGTVLSQSDLGPATSDTLVDLVVSLGPEIVPDVTAQQQALALANIKASGFTVGWITTGYTDTVDAGNVIRQSVVGPAEGGTTVDLVVSLGPPIPGMDTAPCTVDGDINDDCIVNLADISLLAEQWLNDLDMSDYAIVSRNWQHGSSPVIIYEFMASNTNTLYDQDAKTSDWIEIYNRSTAAVDLTGWHLTDKASVPDKWQFISGPVLGPGEYAVLFASGNCDALHINHTNFQLQADGEYLALCRPDQSVAYEYSLKFPEQIADVSCGLFAGQLRHFANPTPGAANLDGYFGIVPDTKFSADRGFYNAPFTVAITCDDPNAAIWYTINSEVPTETSGTLYTGPVTISRTTVLKAKATKPGWISSNVDTQTYIFTGDVKYQSFYGEKPGANWPDPGFAPGIICDRDGTICNEGVMQYLSYGMDQDIVKNTVYSDRIESSLLSIPSISISTNSANLFDEQTGIYVNAKGDGPDWERPASMELIYPDGTRGFQIDMGLRIRGAYSRMGNNPKHAFRCFFRSEYGDSKLKYPLFGEEGVDEFDKIDLRADQNYSWGFCGDARSTFCHEVFTRDTQAAMGQPYTRSRYYHLYLNGHYWGLYQTQERSEARYAASYMGGQAEDYDVIKTGDSYSAQATDGNADAYTRLYNAAVVTGFADSTDYFRAQGKNPDGTDNPDYEKLLDIDNVIAYNLMCYYFGGIDYPLGLKQDSALMINNLYAIYNRNNPDGWKFFIHDAEHTFGLREGGGGPDRTRFLNFGTTYTGPLFFNPVWLHQELFDNAEYRIAFADAVYKHLFNGGALSEEKCFDRLGERLIQVEPAVVAESARWGDAQKRYLSVWHCGSVGNDLITPLTESDWDSAIIRMTNFMTGRTNTVFNWIKNRTELHYPSMNPPVLKINGAAKYGGYISVGDILTLSNPNSSGTIYYTLDGSDPRLICGAVNPAATTGSGPVTLSRTTHVKSRVKYGSTWSALANAVYTDSRIAGSIRISEIMYHPADPNTEFIEVKNIGTEAINLNLIKFTKGVDFTFDDQTLAAGQYTVVVQNRPSFEAKYGAGRNIAGQYTGRLDNDSDRVELQDPAAAVIQNFKYNDNWHELTDGLGYSLTLVDPSNPDLTAWDDKSGWRSSINKGGTPSQASLAALPEDCIVINELLAHSHGTAPDWIELYNTTTDLDIDISGWFLTDDDSDPNMMRKYRLPDLTILYAGTYMVFVGDVSFNDQTPTGSNIPFALSEGGETVHLYSGQGGQVTGLYQTQQKFDASESGVTFGRYEKPELSGGCDFVRQSSPSKGTPNNGPLISDVVITEIYYNPSNGSDYEFVELYNRTGSAVNLWTSVTTETLPGVKITEFIPWRIEGTGFEFPPGTTIPAHSYIVVAKNPANYTSSYGPYDGKLDNSGEEIEIQIPGDMEYGKDRYWIPIDKVDYDIVAPWPDADGNGKSLHRINKDAYGRDYSNWTAAAPTP